MTTKIKITVTYDNESEETLKIASDGVLTDGITELKGYVNGALRFSMFLNICRMMATFLWGNDVKKVEFEEKEE